MICAQPVFGITAALLVPILSKLLDVTIPASIIVGQDDIVATFGVNSTPIYRCPQGTTTCFVEADFNPLYLKQNQT